MFTRSEQRRQVDAASRVDVPPLCPGCRALERRLVTLQAPAREPAQRGSVRWFDRRKGFGFILSDAGQDLYVGRRDLVAGRRWLRKGQRVTFEPSASIQGLEARNVEVVTNDALVEPIVRDADVGSSERDED